MTAELPGCVVVTGSNGGLGSALVAGLLERGVRNIACHYRSNSSSISKVLLDHECDPAAHMFHAELTSEDDVRSMRERVVERFGAVWGVVNLAGASSNAVSWKMSLADFNRILNSNLGSTFLTTREFLPAMRERGMGRIVNVSSILAHMGVAGASHYCAAKAAIESFTRAVAQEVAPKGVTANCIALGYFDKGIISEVPANLLEEIKAKIPQRRLGKAEEIAPLVSYLLSPDSQYMTGQVLHLNGGQYA